jgi:hypothetical protein
MGHSGAQGIGANAPDLLRPGIFSGKGFGDLPDGLAWLRPFGVTGAVSLDHPMTGSSINYGIDEMSGQLLPMLMRYDLGYIDLEQRTLQPLDNPFGPRLLPMS